jgi:hypothetical protein
MTARKFDRFYGVEFVREGTMDSEREEGLHSQPQKYIKVAGK